MSRSPKMAPSWYERYTAAHGTRNVVNGYVCLDCDGTIPGGCEQPECAPLGICCRPRAHPKKWTPLEYGNGGPGADYDPGRYEI